MTFPNGAHVVEVEIGRNTGQASLARYTAVDAVYDPVSGRLLAVSFIDNTLPRTDDLPSYNVGFNGTRCTTNSPGVKGCGEAGAVAAFPAVTSAIADAPAPFWVTDFAVPALRERIWRAMNDADQR